MESLANAAALLPDAQLRVAGDGVQAAMLDGVQGVTTGALSGEVVRHEMNSALVIPIIWYENFPCTIVEAFAAALPVIASRIGALAELVSEGETGLLFEPGNARVQYEAEFTSERNYAQLMAIYQDVIREQRDAG